jgi:hypothetical protein
MSAESMDWGLVFDVIVMFCAVVSFAVFMWVLTHVGGLAAGYVVVGILAAACFYFAVRTAVFMWISKARPDEKGKINPTSYNAVSQYDEKGKIQPTSYNAVSQYEWPLISNDDVFFRIETQG